MKRYIAKKDAHLKNEKDAFSVCLECTELICFMLLYAKSLVLWDFSFRWNMCSPVTVGFFGVSLCTGIRKEKKKRKEAL